jgi:hypothetical protein
VAEPTTGLTFVKASYSSGNCACVEVARAPGLVAVRDSKLVASPVLSFSPQAWSAFVADLRRGRWSAH